MSFDFLESVPIKPHPFLFPGSSIFSYLNHKPSRLLPADDQSFSSDTVTNDNEPNSITTLGTTNNRNNKARL
jgi:hypothetical protein